MSAPDFYFANSAMFRHIHDRYGKAVLIDYWQKLGSEYYASRWQTWREGGLPVIASDWRDYFAKEPGSEVDVTVKDDRVTLDIRICPAIAHLRKNDRHIPEYFCEHCDHINSAMAEHSGHRFIREGGMGSCTQHFVTLTTSAPAPGSTQAANSVDSANTPAAVTTDSSLDSEKPHARLS